MTRYFLVSPVRLSVGQQTGRGEGVSSWMTNSQRLGDRLQRFSGRINRICKPPCGKSRVCSLQGV